MKPTRISTVILLCFCLFLAIWLPGCTPARKPAQPKQTVIPEVTKVFAETRELNTAPPVIQDLAKRHANEEAQFAIVAEGDVWVLATTDDRDESLEVKEVTRRVLDQNTTVLEIKLAELEQQQGKTKTSEDKSKPLVAKLSVKSLDNGAVFFIEEGKEEEDRQEAKKEQAQKSQSRPGTTPQPAKKPGVKETVQTLQVNQPKPDAVIKSPIQVSGQARMANSVVNIRLRDSKGNILKETETIADTGGRFTTSLSFEKPANVSSGRLEVFQLNAPGGSSANTKVIPISFQ